jgi:LPXTG-motif cell wall-anchored protein
MPVIEGIDHGLPSTGGPDRVWLAAGVLLLLAGAGLVLRPSRRAGRRGGHGSR